MTARSNLLVIFGDQHRGEALGRAGNPDVQTTALDRLAGDGVRLSHAYANTPVCTPSRGSLLTGQWPQQHQALSNDLPINTSQHTPSIPRSLGEFSYRCAYVGKWHLGGWPRDRFIPPGSARLGFDDFWAVWNCAHQYFEPKYHLNDSARVIAPTGRYEPEVQTDLALSWLEDHLDHHNSEPFCLFLSYGPPHDPYWPLPANVMDRYQPEALRLRPNCPDTSDTRSNLAGYYGHITALDVQVERLELFLRERAILEVTLVVFTSDHGGMLGSQGYRDKQLPWEESINAPLILRFGDRLPSGTTSDILIGLVDAAPTILGLLTVPVPAAMQGVDFLAQITGGSRDLPTSVYLQEAISCDQASHAGIQPWRGVRTERYTYARNLDGPWMLYDNRADQYQTHNLIDDPALESLRARLDEELRLWMDRLEDPLEYPEVILERLGLTESWKERSTYFDRKRRTSRPSPKSN